MSKMHEIKKLKVREEWIAEAKEASKAKRSKEKDLKPIRKDKKGFDLDELSAVGLKALMEEMPEAEASKEEGYDLLYNGLKIAVVVQSVARLPVTLEHTGWLTPQQYNPEQNCDVYVFVRVAPNTGEMWVGGWISRDDFYRVAKFRVEGQRVGCFEAVEDGHRIRYRILKSLSELGGK